MKEGCPQGPDNDIKSCKELEQLFNEYEEQIQKLCRLYDIRPKSNKGQKKRMKAAAKELRELLMETEDQSFDVSSIPTIIESGTEMIKKIIQVLENDSDLVQPCRARGTLRDLCDTEKKSISFDAIQHDHKIMQLIKYLKMNHKAFPVIQELIQEQMSYKLRTAYYKMGIDTKGCETCAALEDDSEWEVKIPSEVTTDANIKYSVRSSAGQHECSETGLRWRSVGGVSLEYRFVEWESLSKDIMENYRPCGPLMDISVTSGTLKEIHLPHFICVDCESSSDDAVKALHVKDGTVSLERCELSRFHAKLLNPTFSLLGIIAHVHQYFTMKFHCETLIYRNCKVSLNLHVYLILKDKKLKKDVETKEKKNMEIVKPTPHKALKIDDGYTLKTSRDSKIKPPVISFQGLQRLTQHRNKKDAKMIMSGSGGSTLAMQVLWHFRKDLRCARVINSDLDTKELSKQVVDLFLLSNEEHAKQNRKTVLLLLDTREKINDLPIKNFLWEDLIDEIQKRRINTETPAVIILNCIPTDFTLTDTMILPPKLSEGDIKKNQGKTSATDPTTEKRPLESYDHKSVASQRQRRISTS
ncbi:LRR and PYD domains-containing 1b allele 5-like protein [Labeo rohita]|uniref:LRR and PYD domains-containing 1b allele 5-like protein n=1 Tax=Labeo rohita TaxID=84645 RepID=A0A498NQE1_LABRO|nr:LRR and PYD domains-containing 1b allele 5-like protein [Labeo rohita]